MTPELVVENVTKTYANGVRALKGVSLRIPPGMFGLLGPNGAGKSTLMRTIATLQEPDDGSIAFGDLDVLRQKDAVRRTLGYLPQEFGLYPKVSALELLDHFAVLKGIVERRRRANAVQDRAGEGHALNRLSLHRAGAVSVHFSPPRNSHNEAGSNTSRDAGGHRQAVLRPAE